MQHKNTSCVFVQKELAPATTCNSAMLSPRTGGDATHTGCYNIARNVVRNGVGLHILSKAREIKIH